MNGGDVVSFCTFSFTDQPIGLSLCHLFVLHYQRNAASRATCNQGRMKGWKNGKERAVTVCRPNHERGAEIETACIVLPGKPKLGIRLLRELCKGAGHLGRS